MEGAITVLLVFGLFALAIAATLGYFAVHPDNAFRLDEGWKFKNRLEPSDAYVAANGIGRGIAAIVLAVFGIGSIVMFFTNISDQNNARDLESRYAASHQRCESEIRQRFNETIRWHGDQVSNRDAVEALAKELKLEVEIKAGVRPSYGPIKSTPLDTVWVRDPTLSAYHNNILFYFGHQNPTACESPRPPT